MRVRLTSAAMQQEAIGEKLCWQAPMNAYTDINCRLIGTFIKVRTVKQLQLQPGNEIIAVRTILISIS